MLLPRSHQGDPRGAGPPETHRGGCTALAAPGWPRPAGRRQGATLQRLADSAPAPVPGSAERLPWRPAPARTPARGGGARRQRMARGRGGGGGRTRHPRGPLPSPRRRSPGPTRTPREPAEPAGRPLPPRARLRRGSDSSRGSSMGSPRAAGPSLERRTPRASSTAQAWRPRPRRSGGGADRAVTQGMPLRHQPIRTEDSRVEAGPS